MGILDNREKIRSLLSFKPGIFYYLQIIQRKKENPDLSLPEIKRWRLYVTDRKTLDSADEYIEFLCKSLNARAYISILPRDLKKYSVEVLREIVDRIEQDNYKNIHRIGDKVALSEKVMRWKGIIPKSRLLLDFDNPPSNPVPLLTEKGFVVEETIPTKNGIHVVVENCSPELKLGLDYKATNGEVKIKDLEFTIIKHSSTLYYAAWNEEA